MAGTWRMLAGGIVEPGAGKAGSVSAYVVMAAGAKSRIFKLQGSTSEPAITELPSATTIDLGRFHDELREDLEPAIEAIRAQGGTAAIATPKGDWVCGLVRDHLAREGGIDGA